MAQTKLQALSFGPNPIPPCKLTAGERLDELASILAVGLLRLRAGQSSRLSAVPENSSVDFGAYQSSHAVEFATTENALND
jgi:hypothetical protein